MAPIDRREHRQQRVRGAGPSSVQASFGFNFGALGAKSAKQTSLPPQRSSRRTPVSSTPRGINGSGKRHRSASVHRSGSVRAKSTPKDSTVTPQLGKRKRSSVSAQPEEEDGDEDELGPNREEDVPSTEKSRRVVGTVSPIHEENDDLQDELSILEEEGSVVRKQTPNGNGAVNGTPVSVLAQRRTSSGTGPTRTPIAGRIGSMTLSSRQSIPRRSKSTEPGLATPSLLPNGRPRLSSASRFGPAFDTPGAAPEGGESEDELSPPQMNGSTPRVISSVPRTLNLTLSGEALDVDELSSPMQPSTIGKTPATKAVVEKRPPVPEPESTRPTAKRGRPRRVIQDEEDEEPKATPAMEVRKRGRPAKITAVDEDKPAATPTVSKPEKKKTMPKNAKRSQLEEMDELSPNKEIPVLPAKKSRKQEKEVVISDGEVSDEFEDEEIEEEPIPSPQVPSKRRSPKAKPSSEMPPRKRHKFLGPKHAISVMRIKGSAVRGITVADTTRTILEETIDYRLGRMAEKLQTSQDSAQRKDLRSEINLSLSFKESLNEKLLDLQDANDVLSTNLKKMKLFKRENAELRKEILTLQNSRHEIALEHDDVQMNYETEKEKVDSRNQLSANMFDIEAAIQNGKDEARRTGREDEGPEIPLTMLLDMVGRDVGSGGGGLLSNVKSFNGTLERAAAWLEGRV